VSEVLGFNEFLKIRLGFATGPMASRASTKIAFVVKAKVQAVALRVIFPLGFAIRFLTDDSPFGQSTAIRFGFTGNSPADGLFDVHIVIPHGVMHVTGVHRYAAQSLSALRGISIA
jgi:hypothetical protein